MKLKQKPEDFRVEEITSATAGPTGEFAFYRLDKTGWTTTDAVAAIRRRWRIDFRRVSYGGLKDRHAVTSQYLTIYRGPQRNLSHERIGLTYLGRRDEPYTAANIEANRFSIVLRGLTEEELERARIALAEVADAGMPNYFDDQRFGSVSDSREFVAKEMVLGRFDRALWLALAAPYEYDRAKARCEKALLRELWGDWPALRERLPRGHARSLVDYLVHHPADLKGAVARLRPDLLAFYLSAYQSYLWNRILSAWLQSSFDPTELGFVELKLGRVPVPIRVAKEQRGEWEQILIPLLSARVKSFAGGLPFMEDVIREEGLTLPELRIKGMQKPFFSKGERAGCVRPANLATQDESDDLNRPKRKLTLKFDLPRGSYATMLVKRLTSCSPAP